MGRPGPAAGKTKRGQFATSAAADRGLLRDVLTMNLGEHLSVKVVHTGRGMPVG